MGAEDPGTDDSWFGDDTGYKISKAEKESGMKVAEDTGQGWTKADNPPGLGPLGLAAGVLTMGASFPVSLIAGKVASAVEQKVGLKNVVDASMLGGTVKNRVGTARTRGLIEDEDAGTFYTASKDQKIGRQDPEGSPEETYTRSMQTEDSPTSPSPTQVAERDEELEDQMEQARRGRRGRRSLLSPGNIGSGYFS